MENKEEIAEKIKKEDKKNIDLSNKSIDEQIAHLAIMAQEIDKTIVEQSECRKKM